MGAIARAAELVGDGRGPQVDSAERGGAHVLGVDVDDDANPDVTFNIPDSLTGFVGVYAANDTDGTAFLFAHLEDGTTVRIDAAQ